MKTRRSHLESLETVVSPHLLDAGTQDIMKSVRQEIRGQLDTRNI
jgi:hypothetical protein